MGERMQLLKSNNEKKFEQNDSDDPYASLLRLKGGGENSLSTGSSAWGTASSEPSNNSNGKMSTNTSQQSPENGVWGQSGSKSQVSPPSTQAGGGSPGSQNTTGPTNTTKQQLEQLHNLREAIFSQDGWGVQFVNQDTSWDIPNSPEPPNKAESSSGSPSWKPNVNNGTELWEANLKNGGQPPPQSQPQQKTPWGHTPSNNIGGTWGEDDESESSNVWTGSSQNQGQQWGPGNSNANNSNPMWNGSKKEDDWTPNGNGNWRDQRNPDHRTMGTESRDNRQGNRGANNSETIRLLDHREQMRQMPGEMRGDPRGITGRLNGAGNDTFWGQSGHSATPQPMQHQKLPGSSNGIGWEDGPLNTPKRTTFDDGTSLWGNPQQGSHWKDLPSVGNMGRNNIAPGPLSMNQPRIKQDVSMWGNSRNGPWDEMGGQSATWDEPNSWAKQKMTNPLWENELDWGQKPNKLHLTKEIIWNSKQFRMLVDLGHKKEDVENALRIRDMNMEEALELLNAIRRTDNWGNRTDDHYDTFSYNQKYPLGPNVPLSNFPPSNNDPNLMNLISNSVSSGNTSVMNNAFVQKMLLQGGNMPGLGNNPTANNRNVPSQQQPSTQQLKVLVGQIQMAVQAGFLNNQILKQPLAPQTLALLNQLLQQIKILQQLLAHQMNVPAYTANGKPNNVYLQFSLVITKTKQTIATLQNQISTQQAAYVKQHIGEVIKPPLVHEPISGMQNTFAELNINKEPQTVQQSKLNQWINKDRDSSEFCRAPGANSKLLTNTNFGVTPSEGNWANGRNTETAWPDGGGDSSNDKDGHWPTSQSITDLVPEFEPGKPWKGNQLKSIEDDPTITPGSVVRSPLSIPTIKDPKLYNPNPVKGLQETDNISSFGLNSTWSNNLPPTTSSGKLQNSDPSVTSPLTSDLWTTTPKQPKGPPGFSDDSWPNNNSTSWGNGGQRNSGNWAGSTWLLLKNLTAQIDGSTLRTLCMQHGPLMSFNLYLYQGFALAKYSSREEAAKAQTTLNNCVLGNTTILAENPSEWDAGVLLQQLATQQNGSSGGNWRGSNKQTPTESWNVSWPNNNTSSSSANLWSSPSVDCNDPRGTPSNLNSFLPNDLLGGESI